MSTQFAAGIHIRFVLVPAGGTTNDRDPCLETPVDVRDRGIGLCKLDRDLRSL